MAYKVDTKCERYADEEAVAALQALVLYTVMIMFDGDSDAIMLPEENFAKAVFVHYWSFLKLRPRCFASS